MHTCMVVINLLDATWSFTFVEAHRLPSLVLLVNIFSILICIHMDGYHKQQYHHAITFFPKYTIHHYFYSNIITSFSYIYQHTTLSLYSCHQHVQTCPHAHIHISMHQSFYLLFLFYTQAFYLSCMHHASILSCTPMHIYFSFMYLFSFVVLDVCP